MIENSDNSAAESIFLGIGGRDELDAADPGTTVAVKNGWLDVDDDAGRWAVNSDALITVNGDLIAISVLTQHNDDEQSGITMVESLAKIAANAVG
jgi:hypothetical protein